MMLIIGAAIMVVWGVLLVVCWVVLDRPTMRGVLEADPLIEARWGPPRCRHGNIILGCPLDGCPEQNDYLAEQWRRIEEYETRIRRIGPE